MKTLHLYLTRQVLATLLLTVAVFTFVLLLGNALNEIMSVLVKRQGTLGSIMEAFALLIPFVLAFALPLGMMTAALLVFGRFSADQELTAVRSSGISLAALVSPILILSLALCGLNAWINMEVAPRCRIAYKRLLSEMELKMGTSVLPEERLVKDFSPWMFSIQHINHQKDGDELRQIFVYHLDTNGQVDRTITADRGRIERTNDLLIAKLFSAHTLDRDDTTGIFSPSEEAVVELQLKPGGNKEEESISITDMTIGQLGDRLRELEQTFSVPDTHKLSRDELARQKRLLEKQSQDLTMPVRVQIQREIATSFACFGFTLVGIPLGIRAHRRETNIGIVMALALVFFYYSFILLGQALRMHAGLAPHLIVWVPNFIFQTIGAVMLWRANKGI